MKKTNIDNMVTLAQKYCHHILWDISMENFCAQTLMVEAIRVMNSNIPLWKKRVLLTVIDSLGPVESDRSGYEYLPYIENDYSFWKKRLSETVNRNVDKVTVGCIDADIDFEDYTHREYGMYTIKKNGVIISERHFIRISEDCTEEEVKTSITSITDVCSGTRGEYFKHDEFVA